MRDVSFFVAFMSGPIRVTGPTAQSLRLSVDVSCFAVIDLSVTVYEGSNVVVRLTTGTQSESEEPGWSPLESLDALSAGQTGKRTYSGLLNYARWEITSSGDATIYVRGIARIGNYYSDERVLARLAAGTTALTITAGAASTWKTTSGALTLSGAGGMNLQGNGTTVASIDGAASALTLAAGKSLSGASGSGGLSLGSLTGDTTLPTGSVSWSGASGKDITMAATGTGRAFLTAGGAATVTGGGASTWSTTSGALSLSGAGGLNLQGGGTTVASIDSGGTTVTLAAGKSLSGASGSGAVSLGSMTGDVTFPTGVLTWRGASNKNVELTAAGSGTVTVESSTGAITIGDTASARTVKLATGAAAQTATVGSKTGTSSLALYSGTSNTLIDMASTGNLGILFGFAGSYGGGQNVIFIGNLTTSPSSNPSSGGILYAQSGAGKWRGSSGTTTTFGPAGPHCGQCGYDCWRVAQVNWDWGSWHYECAHCDAVYKGGPATVLDRLTDEQKKELLRPGMSLEEVKAVLQPPTTTTKKA